VRPGFAHVSHQWASGLLLHLLDGGAENLFALWSRGSFPLPQQWLLVGRRFEDSCGCFGHPRGRLLRLVDVYDIRIFRVLWFA